MIHRNLVSITCLLHFGFRLDFHGDVLKIRFGNDILYTYLPDGLFTLNIISNNCSPSSCIVTVSKEEKIWHARLGHIGQDRMNKLAKSGLLGSISKVTLPLVNFVLWVRQQETFLESIT